MKNKQQSAIYHHKLPSVPKSTFIRPPMSNIFWNDPGPHFPPLTFHAGTKSLPIVGAYLIHHGNTQWQGLRRQGLSLMHPWLRSNYIPRSVPRFTSGVYNFVTSSLDVVMLERARKTTLVTEATKMFISFPSFGVLKRLMKHFLISI